MVIITNIIFLPCASGLVFWGWFITSVIVIALPDLRLKEEIHRLSNKLDGAIGGNANGASGPEKGASVSSPKSLFKNDV